MKMKLFLFLSLIVGSISLSVFFSNNASAAGESYKWINETTIEGTLGGYDNKIMKVETLNYNQKNVAVKKVDFTRVGTTSEFKAPLGLFYMTGGPGGTQSVKCAVQLTITISETDVASGSLRANDPDKPACPNSQLSSPFAIGDTANGPNAASLTPPGAAPADPTPSMCGVNGIGWMICPIANSIADGIAGAYDIVKGFLVFNSYTTDTTNGIYPAWAIMRNFANVAFVIAFMIIIYSQLTSVGISNYGIKKMLPRLIVAAILVNASYWICGIAVDVSNILGSSLYGLLNSFIPAVKGNGIDVEWQDATLAILSGTAVGAVSATMLLAYAGSMGALLWMLVPILLSAVFAIFVAVIILAARQVILIILIVISPLAFVAYLLPNTSKWYSKWQSTFFTLLLMYPMIAVIFGGSQLASAIILSATDLTMVMVLLALAVQVVPLAITPLLMKLSTGVLGRFAGIVNNPKRGPIDALKNRAKEKQDLATKRGLDPNNRGFVNRMGQKRAFSRRREKLQGEVHESAADADWAGKTVTDPGLQSLVQQKQTNAIASNVANGVNNKLTTRSLATNGGAGQIGGALGDAANDDDIKAQIKVAIDEATAKSIAEIEVSTKAEIPPGALDKMGERFAQAIAAGDSIGARAVQNILLTSGSKGLETYREKMGSSAVSNGLNNNEELSNELRKNMINKHGGVKASANDLMQQAITGAPMQQVSNNASTWQMPDEELVHQKPASIQLALKHVDQAQAARIIGNEELAKNLTKELRAEFHNIAGVAAPSQSPASSSQSTGPIVLNVPHNPTIQGTQPPINTPSSNPSTGRTSPPTGSSGGSTGPGGLWTP